MKKSVLGYLAILSASVSAFAGDPSFNKLVCRSYDYYQLAGNRKVVEITVSESADGTYEAVLYHNFETLLANGQYKESSRMVQQDVTGISCQQADAAVDPKVIACSTSGIGSYFGLTRVDRTVIGSAFSSNPGRVFKTTVYEALLFGNGVTNDGEDGQGIQNGLQFDPKDCVLN